MTRCKDRWKRMPNTSWRELCVLGTLLRRTATHLAKERLKMTGPGGYVGTFRDLPVGYAYSESILQPLAAEYLLKGLSLRDKESFLMTHDLHKLYGELKPETQDEICRLGTALEGADMPAFLRLHRNDFVDWRYPLEDLFREYSASRFDKALAVLEEVCRPGSHPRSRSATNT